MKLVLIHGRSQQGKDPKLLEKDWLDALHYGCRRAGVRLPEDMTVVFPYYGDILDAAVKRLDSPLSAEVTARGPAEEARDNKSGLRGELLFELAQNAGVSQREAALELGNASQTINRGPGNWEWVQAIARALDRVPGLNARFIDLFTRDVYVYLTFPGVRQQIDSVVAQAIGNEPCVVLAHSLGTVVAYNVLGQRAAAPAFPRLVTVGSPLGVRAIQQQLASPLTSPPCIGNWFNAYDDRDIVALRPLDSTSFNVTPAIENKSDVLNFTDNRHGIAGYLADPIVAQKVCQFL